LINGVEASASREVNLIETFKIDSGGRLRKPAGCVNLVAYMKYITLWKLAADPWFLR
jgi:hypothetical protein